MTETFRTNDVLRFVPTMTARRLQWLDESGVCLPEKPNGAVRYYRAWDIAQVAVIQALHQKGVRLHGIKHALKSFTPAALCRAYAKDQFVLVVFASTRPVVVLSVDVIVDGLIQAGIPSACFKEHPKQRAA